MKRVKLEVTRVVQSSGQSPVYDKKEYNEELYERSQSILVNSTQTNTDVAFVPDGTCIFYENGYNIFSRFDNLGQERENIVKVVEIKENSVILMHEGYQQHILVDGEEIKNHTKKFEVKIGGTINLHSFIYDIDMSYSIKVKEINL